MSDRASDDVAGASAASAQAEVAAEIPFQVHTLEYFINPGGGDLIVPGFSRMCRNVCVWIS